MAFVSANVETIDYDTIFTEQNRARPYGESADFCSFFWSGGSSPEGKAINVGWTPIRFPSPADTLRSFHSLWFDRQLSLSIVTSLFRVLAGFAVSAAIGVPLGVIAASYPFFHAFIKPLTVFGRNVPIAALIPLTLIWFGLGEMQKVMFIFLASVAFVVFDTIHSVQDVSDRYLDTAYTLGAKITLKSGARFRSNQRTGLRDGGSDGRTLVSRRCESDPMDGMPEPFDLDSHVGGLCHRVSAQLPHYLATGSA